MKNLFLLLLLIGCSTPAPKPKETLVLIQGIHLDGDAWGGLKQELSGSNFLMMDLNRLGRDDESAPTLKQLAALACQHIPSRSILIGHSYGGAIANQMVGTCPEKIQKLIYVTAVVPLNDEKPFDLMNKTDQRNYSKVVTFGRTKIIPKEAGTFFKLTDPMVTINNQLPKLHSEWISLISEPITFDEKKFAAIPKSYIYTEKDPVLSLTTQFQFTSRTGIKNVVGIKTGHFPMISDPKKLADIILELAKN